MERLRKEDVESYAAGLTVFDSTYTNDSRQRRPGFAAPVSSEFIIDRTGKFKVVAYIERFAEDGESILKGDPQTLYYGEDLATAVKIYNDNY